MKLIISFINNFLVFCIYLMLGTLILFNQGGGADIFFGLIMLVSIICHFFVISILVYFKKLSGYQLFYPVFFLILFFSFYSKYLKFIWDLKSIQ